MWDSGASQKWESLWLFPFQDFLFLSRGCGLLGFVLLVFQAIKSLLFLHCCPCHPHAEVLCPSLKALKIFLTTPFFSTWIPHRSLLTSVPPLVLLGSQLVVLCPAVTVTICRRIGLVRFNSTIAGRGQVLVFSY